MAVPIDDEFDEGISQLGEDEGGIVTGIDAPKLSDFIQQDLRRAISTEQPDWRFDLYKGWRTVRKRELGPSEVENAILAK